MKRRHFLASSGALIGDFAFLNGLAPVSAAETKSVANLVKVSDEIEPIVRLIESTSRKRLLEEVGSRVKSGKLSYREILAGLQLAGVRNVQPRPVGFKFHSVLVVNSAHMASMASPDRDRWLPIFWALDYYKQAEKTNIQQGNWHMTSVDEAAVPKTQRARKEFVRAMENWDVAAADTAVAGMARSNGAHQAFELFASFGSRDFRDIGHKAIFVANSFRTLQNIGWHHAEPVLRSLTYALLAHEGENPAKRDSDLDRPWRDNQRLIEDIPKNWLGGEHSITATHDLLETLRQACPHEACLKAVQLFKAGLGPKVIWDTGFQFASELLMRNPGIVSLHAVTSANAMHYSYQTCQTEKTRQLLTLQFVAFLTMFRRDPKSLEHKPERIHTLQPLMVKGSTTEQLETIFAGLQENRQQAARQILSFCKQGSSNARQFIDNARRMLFMKGNNAHDYKFTAAVLEDYYHISPGLREAFIAASVYNLRGSTERDNPLVQRTRAALS